MNKRSRKSLLRRDDGFSRNDSLFVLSTEDAIAPKEYFSLFKFPRVTIKTLPTEDCKSAAQYVLERIDALRKEYSLDEDDELWIALDTDHYIQNTHLRSYTAVLTQAVQKQISVAVSKPCFDLWLLLHHKPDLERVKSLKDCTEVQTYFKELLPTYKKNSINHQNYSFEQMAEAIHLAIELDESSSRIPESNTTRIHLFMLQIIKRIPRSEIPAPLAQFK